MVKGESAMPSEKLSLQRVTRGFSVRSESSTGNTKFLVTITREGKIKAEGGVPQDTTNFLCVVDGDGARSPRIKIF